MNEKETFAYAISDGFAIETLPRLDEGSVFLWEGVEWEVVANLKTPCCGYDLALVRRKGSGLSRWVGIACRKCASTYEFLREESPHDRGADQGTPG